MNPQKYKRTAKQKRFLSSDPAFRTRTVTHTVASSQFLGNATSALLLISTLTFGFAIAAIVTLTQTDQLPTLDPETNELKFSFVDTAVVMLFSISAISAVYTTTFGLLEHYYVQMVAGADRKLELDIEDIRVLVEEAEEREGSGGGNLGASGGCGQNFGGGHDTTIGCDDRISETGSSGVDHNKVHFKNGRDSGCSDDMLNLNGPSKYVLSSIQRKNFVRSASELGFSDDEDEEEYGEENTIMRENSALHENSESKETTCEEEDGENNNSQDNSTTISVSPLDNKDNSNSNEDGNQKTALPNRISDTSFGMKEKATIVNAPSRNDSNTSKKDWFKWMTDTCEQLETANTSRENIITACEEEEKATKNDLISNNKKPTRQPPQNVTVVPQQPSLKKSQTVKRLSRRPSFSSNLVHLAGKLADERAALEGDFQKILQSFNWHRGYSRNATWASLVFIQIACVVQLNRYLFTAWFDLRIGSYAAWRSLASCVQLFGAIMVVKLVRAFRKQYRPLLDKYRLVYR